MPDKIPQFAQEYTCAACRETYRMGWSAEDALNEYKENGFEEDSKVVVCDDCYKKIMRKLGHEVAD